MTTAPAQAWELAEKQFERDSAIVAEQQKHARAAVMAKKTVASVELKRRDGRLREQATANATARLLREIDRIRRINRD